MSRRLLVINGSPRRGGNVATMLEAIEREAVGKGFDVSVVRMADLHVAPCAGCMACRTKGCCVLPEDDAHRTAALLRDADAVVVGAPCYWGNMPGQLKVLFDRMVYAMMGEGKRGLPRPLHKGHYRDCMHHAVAFQHPVRPVGRHRQGLARDTALQRFRHCRHRAAWRNERGAAGRRPQVAPLRQACGQALASTGRRGTRASISCSRLCGSESLPEVQGVAWLQSSRHDAAKGAWAFGRCATSAMILFGGHTHSVGLAALSDMPIGWPWCQRRHTAAGLAPRLSFPGCVYSV